MPRKFKADAVSDDEHRAAVDIIRKVGAQLGSFITVCGEFRDADRENSVTLLRREWAALLEHIRKLTPKRDVTEQMMAPARSYWAVLDEMDRALRNDERISGNEAIRRAARKLHKPVGTVKRHYNASRKLVQEHYPTD